MKANTSAWRLMPVHATKKYRVIDNLPGNRRFCPLVSKTKYLSEAVNQDPSREARERLAMYPADHALRRQAQIALCVVEDDEIERFERIVAESFDRADERVGENNPLA